MKAVGSRAKLNILMIGIDNSKSTSDPIIDCCGKTLPKEAVFPEDFSSPLLEGFLNHMMLLRHELTSSFFRVGVMKISSRFIKPLLQVNISKAATLKRGLLMEKQIPSTTRVAISKTKCVKCLTKSIVVLAFLFL